MVTDTPSRLAAVDMHTALHIVSHCLSGPLAEGRTIILVTHHISMCLPVASYLVELAQGKILRKGTIQEFKDLGQLEEVLEAEDETPEDDKPVQDPENEVDSVEQDQKYKGDRGDAKKLIEAEARAEGRVSWLTYVTYIRAAGISSWIFIVALMLLIRAINIGNQVNVGQLSKSPFSETHIASYSLRGGVPHIMKIRLRCFLSHTTAQEIHLATSHPLASMLNLGF